MYQFQISSIVFVQVLVLVQFNGNRLVNFAYSRPALMCIVVLLLTGCQPFRDMAAPTAPPVSPPDGSALIQGAAELNANLAKSQGVTPEQVVELGYSNVSNACDLYFSALIKANNQIQMTKADLTSFGTAAAVISTLTGATPTAVGSTAALFGLASSTTANFEQYAMATPYPVQTYTLIKKALTAYAQAAPPSSMTSISIQQATSFVAGYARLCTFAGISELSQQAIAKGDPGNAAGSSSIFSTSDRTQYLNNVDALLSADGKPLSLSDSDYVTLAVITDKSATNLPQVQIKNLTTQLMNKGVDMSKMSDQAQLAIATYLGQLITSNSVFAKQVAAAKAALSAGTVPNTAPMNVMSMPNIQIK